jgi:hypothetical protein
MDLMICPWWPRWCCGRGATHIAHPSPHSARRPGPKRRHNVELRVTETSHLSVATKVHDGGHRGHYSQAATSATDAFRWDAAATKERRSEAEVVCASELASIYSDAIIVRTPSKNSTSWSSLSGRISTDEILGLGRPPSERAAAGATSHCASEAGFWILTGTPSSVGETRGWAVAQVREICTAGLKEGYCGVHLVLLIPTS